MDQGEGCNMVKNVQLKHQPAALLAHNLQPEHSTHSHILHKAGHTQCQSDLQRISDHHKPTAFHQLADTRLH